MTHNIESIPLLTRRALMVLCGALSLATMASCKTSPVAENANSVTGRLIRLADTASVVAKREPNLPAVRALAVQPTDPIMALSEADQGLLTSSLYLDVRERLASTREPTGEAAIRETLARPLHYPRYTSEYLSRTLGATKVRMETDSSYREAMFVMPNDPFLHGHCENPLTGREEPCALAKFNRVIFIRNLMWMDP